MGSPPDQACLRYVSDHLLVSDLNEVKFVTAPGPMDTSISAFDGTHTMPVRPLVWPHTAVHFSDSLLNLPLVGYLVMLSYS